MSPSSATSVVVDTDQIDASVLAAVCAACVRARAEVVPWRQAADGERRPPALLIGALRRGERRIPAELVDVATSIAPEAAILLMSDEPLVRPMVSTHSGRVTLLAQPASPARVRGTVRMLLAERGDLRRERLDADVWTALLPANGDQPAPPALQRDADGALTVLFPLVCGWSGAEPLCDEAHLLMLARIDEEERLLRMHQLLGHAAGLVHLAAGCQHWVAFWPSTTSPLLLCSPLRLPHLCNLADAASQQILHLTASPGDLVVALSHELPIVAPGNPGLTLSDGGAAFLDQIEAELPAAAARPSGLVVEIR